MLDLIGRCRVYFFEPELDSKLLTLVGHNDSLNVFDLWVKRLWDQDYLILTTIV